MSVSPQVLLCGGNYISYLLHVLKVQVAGMLAENLAEVGVSVAAHLQMIVITGGKSIRLYFRQVLNNVAVKRWKAHVGTCLSPHCFRTIGRTLDYVWWWTLDTLHHTEVKSHNAGWSTLVQ